MRVDANVEAKAIADCETPRVTIEEVLLCDEGNGTSQVAAEERTRIFASRGSGVRVPVAPPALECAVSATQMRRISASGEVLGEVRYILRALRFPPK
jgi:hypothetical protein